MFEERCPCCDSDNYPSETEIRVNIVKENGESEDKLLNNYEYNSSKKNGGLSVSNKKGFYLIVNCDSCSSYVEIQLNQVNSESCTNCGNSIGVFEGDYEVKNDKVEILLKCSNCYNGSLTTIFEQDKSVLKKLFHSPIY